MRVLQVHTRMRGNGGETSLVDAEASLLRTAGHTVDQFLYTNALSPARTALALATSAWNPAAYGALKRQITQSRPDVVHVHGTWYAMSPAVYWAARRSGTPIVLTMHNYRLLCINGMFMREESPCTDCVGGGLRQGVRHRCYRNSFAASGLASSVTQLHRWTKTYERTVDRFIALTEFARSEFVRGGLPEDRTVVRMNFTEDYGRRETSPRSSHEVLFVGRLSKEKGVSVLLEAWRKANVSNLALRVVGDGPERQRLERQAPPGVTFSGRVERSTVANLMRQARAVVVPSIWFEGQPMVMLESMSAATPLLASKLGGLTETTDFGKAAILAEPKDVDDWAAALTKLGDDQLLEHLGNQGRRLYEERHTPQRALASLVLLYEQARHASRTR